MARHITGKELGKPMSTKADQVDQMEALLDILKSIAEHLTGVEDIGTVSTTEVRDILIEKDIRSWVDFQREVEQYASQIAGA